MQFHISISALVDSGGGGVSVCNFTSQSQLWRVVVVVGGGVLVCNFTSDCRVFAHSETG